MSSFSSPAAPAGSAPNGQPATKTASPANGASLAFNDNAVDQTYYLTPAGLILGITMTFPSDANSRIGQKLRICSTQTITTVTLSGAGTVISAVATLTGGGSIFYEKVAANTWIASAG